MTNPSGSQNRITWRWITVLGFLGVLVAVFAQWRTISNLRHENDLLRAQPKAAATEAPTQPAVSGAGEAVDMEQSQKDRLELLRLRNEVRQLRERIASAAPDSPPITSQSVTPGTLLGESRDDAVRQLGAAAMRGDTAALEKMAKLAAAARTMSSNEQATALSDIRRAFEALGTEAGKGNAGALQAVWQASRMQDLQGFAVTA